MTNDHIADFRGDAATYDDIFANAAWRPQLAVVEGALDAAPLHGSCAEFGAGTGWWTARYASRVDDLTLLDVSPEMLAVARERLGTRCAYEVVDLTAWRPTRTWDCAVAINVTEHLPDAALAAMAAAVDRVSSSEGCAGWTRRAAAAVG